MKTHVARTSHDESEHKKQKRMQQYPGKQENKEPDSL